jgi:hypothetical protein
LLIGFPIESLITLAFLNPICMVAVSIEKYGLKLTTNYPFLPRMSVTTASISYFKGILDFTPLIVTVRSS